MAKQNQQPGGGNPLPMGIDVLSMALYTLRLVLIGFGISKPYWLLVAGFWALKVNYPPPPPSLELVAVVGRLLGATDFWSVMHG